MVLENDADLGVKKFCTCVDIVDVDQDSWSNFVAIESGFIFAETAKARLDNVVDLAEDESHVIKSMAPSL